MQICAGCGRLVAEVDNASGRKYCLACQAAGAAEAPARATPLPTAAAHAPTALAAPYRPGGSVPPAAPDAHAATALGDPFRPSGPPVPVSDAHAETALGEPFRPSGGGPSPATDAHAETALGAAFGSGAVGDTLGAAPSGPLFAGPPPVAPTVSALGYGSPSPGGYGAAPSQPPPAAGAPGYGPAVQGAPGYGPPMQGAPGYGPVVQGAPGYAPPMQGAPGYAPPMQGAPGYGAPPYGPGPYGQGVPGGYPGYGPAQGVGPGAYPGYRRSAAQDGKRALLIAGGAVLAAVVIAVLVLVLRKPPPIYVYAYLHEDGDAFSFDVSTDPRADVTVKDQKVRADDIGHAELRVPRSAFAVGTERVEVVATLDGGKRRGSYALSVTRETMKPSLRLGMPTGSEARTLSCGGPFCSASVGSLPNATLKMSLDAPVGTRLEIRGATVVVDDKVRREPYVVDVRRELGAIEVAALDPEASKGSTAPALSVPIKVTSPDAIEARGALELPAGSVRTLAAQFFAGAAKGPVRFGDGDQLGKDRAAVVMTGADADDARLLGTGRLSDVLLVFVERTLDGRDGGVCGPYSAYGVGGDYAPRTLVDAEVVAYERRTGKEVARQRFMAQPTECPMSLYLNAGETPRVTDYVADATVDAWAKAILAQRR
ncbi:MAG: hypothetical protein IT373_08540 [Polyangiaceae bacterium]|nr:hypothetical protein [Polyangiaceae bacterium]